MYMRIFYVFCTDFLRTLYKIIVLMFQNTEGGVIMEQAPWRP